jgi:hypothetical protein
VLGYPARWLGQRYEHAFLVATHCHIEMQFSGKSEPGKSAKVESVDIGPRVQFVVEAGWTGVTLAELGPRLAFCDFVRPRYTDEMRYRGMILSLVVQHALVAACKRERYSYGNLLRLAWHRLILRRKPPELAALAVICTQGVAQWWRKAGFDPVPGIPDWAILPDDFWGSAAVEKLTLKEGRWGTC